jgi:M6 family metalloprotease-like protein
MAIFTATGKKRLPGVLLFLALAAACLDAGAVKAADPRLHELRALRRQQQRLVQAHKDKSGEPARFGLLVIPVDFSDARLSDEYDPVQQIGGRLWAGTGESLRHYFSVASGGLLDLSVTLAPVIHLTGSRSDYSDVGWNGFSRTRMLATESLEAVRGLGLEFRSLDMEGPDRLPGSGDDDGQLDGVLILHSGPGQENDAEGGLIQPLQFFLEEPVVSGGIAASFYAVASLSSGPGIWAHETGHLLGMEDRYDPLLHPEAGGVDVRSLGGLGRFSLMASGAWGTGQGWGAALPDAYTCLQMGWTQELTLPTVAGEPDSIVPWRENGAAYRIWTAGESGAEFFLLETRNPLQTAPFDAGLPAGQLLVYHLDEAVPEGNWAVDGPQQWHLRVNLVEADADGQLRSGLDDGRAEDLFPGPLQVTEFGPGTVPSSWGYDGNSQVTLAAIASADSLVTLRASAAEEPVVDFSFSFSGPPGAVLALQARSLGQPVTQLQCRLEVTSEPRWGSFPGGSSSLDFNLVQTSPGLWVPGQDVVFLLDDLPPDGASSAFSFRFAGGGWQGTDQQRNWIWTGSVNPLDFGGEWPGDWQVLQEQPGTTWHRWAGAPPVTADGAPVLAATGESHVTAAAWPEIQYGNSAWVQLLSPELGSGVGAVRMVHAIGSERLTPGVAMDGGRLRWAGPGGITLPANPLDGYGATIDPGAVNVLAGAEAFADTLLLVDGLVPVWQVDVIPLPADPGPWRLQLEFGSNTLWRRQGWIVARLDSMASFSGHSAFPVAWDDEQGLTWNWLSGGADLYSVQGRAGSEHPWQDIATGVPVSHLQRSTVLAGLAGGPASRSEVRVLAHTGQGPVASRPVVVYPDGGYAEGQALGLPRPNPARGQVSFQVKLSAGRSARLRIYDVRGRLVYQQPCPAGDYLMTWDGHDGRGGRAPAGLYFLRLEGSGPVTTRKVVLLH